MKYFRLFELQNQYPNINNYFRENTISSVDSLYNHGDAVLRGIFPQNERRFPLSNIAFIRPVANTSIRFIIKVKKSVDDEFPRYFTSFNYYAELEQSILSSNPYFLNLSLLDTNIVEFDLTDSIIAFKNQLESESSRNVKMFRNNFLKIIDSKSKDSKTETYGSDEKAVVNPTDMEQMPINEVPIVQNNNPQTNTETGLNRVFANSRARVERFRRGETPLGRLLANSRDRAERFRNGETTLGRLVFGDTQINTSIENENTIAPTEEPVKRIFTTDIQSDVNTEAKPKSDVEKMIEEVIENPYLDLVDEENQIYVDYRDLCYYISWCLSSPTLDSIENNGVLTSDEISKFELTKTTNDTKKEENPNQNSGDGVSLEPTGKYFEYDIIRLTIPATFEQSKMMFRNQAGEMQEIQTDKYGLVGRFCMEENSFSGNHYIYQKTQIGPCAENNIRGGGGRPQYNGYGYSGDYDVRVGSVDFINQQRDFENIQQ